MSGLLTSVAHGWFALMSLFHCVLKHNLEVTANRLQVLLEMCIVAVTLHMSVSQVVLYILCKLHMQQQICSYCNSHGSGH